MTDAPEAIEQVIADAHEELKILRRHGAVAQADALEAFLSRIVTSSAREYLTWHDEHGASLLSGKPTGWFRSRFAEWQRRRLARLVGRGRRQYREVVIPFKQDLAGAVEDARRQAMMDHVA